jgi:membrane protein required for colicin V production
MLNWLDIALAAILLLAVIIGFIKGFVRELMGLLVIVAAIVLAGRFYDPVASFMRKFISNPMTANFLGFFIVFVVILIVGGVVASWISRLTKGSLTFVTHLLGGIIGFLEGILICCALVSALYAFPLNDRALVNSKLRPLCDKATSIIIGLVPQDLKDKIKAKYSEITQPPINPAEKKDGQKI